MSATAAIDLTAYFDRIGYRGPRAATLPVLEALMAAHVQAIPFENLDVVRGAGVDVGTEAVFDKLVRRRRGGYCFEQNGLLRAALVQIGFRVTGLAARVMWNVPDGVATARGHMLLKVDIDGQPYIADVGFGGLTLTAPLRLAPDVEQRTPHELFRLVAAGDAYIMQASLHGEWRPLYRFDLHEQLAPDYEVTNWYLSNHPGSHFVTSLIAARPDRGCRYALRNDQLTVHYLDGSSERRRLADAGEIRAALGDIFHLAVPAGEEVDRALQRLVEPAE